MNNIAFSVSNEINKQFCEEYIRLAELIILFEKDKIEELDEFEKKERYRLMSNGANEKSLNNNKLIFMRKRVEVIAKAIANNNALKKVQNDLSRFLRKNRIQTNYFNLSFKNGELLSPTEIYINYIYLVEKMKVIDLNVNYKTKR